MWKHEPGPLLGEEFVKFALCPLWVRYVDTGSTKFLFLVFL